MAAIAFDTLAFAKRLKNAGVPDKQAEEQAEATAEISSALVKDQVVTKEDLKDLRFELKDFITKTAFKTAISIVSILGGLQTLFHFVK